MEKKESNRKVNLNIIMDENTRDDLFRIIPSGEVSKFVYQLIKKEVEKMKKEIAAEYQQVAEDKELTPQLKKWNFLKAKYGEKK